MIENPPTRPAGRRAPREPGKRGAVEVRPGRLVVDTDDLAAAETHLGRFFAALRFGSPSARAGARMVRQQVGAASHATLRFGTDVAYSTEPIGCWSVLLVRDGTAQVRLTGAEPVALRRGAVLALEPPDRPHSGVMRHAAYDLITLEPELLARVADLSPRERPPRLGANAPASAAAARRLAGAIEHFGANAAALAGNPLTTATAADFLAAVALDAFPATAGEPTHVDRNDTHSETVRRAIAFMETRAAEDISLADIASAAYVTIRAVQLAFQRHLHTTPVQYLRRIRLDCAHADLLAAAPGGGETVTAIAYRWGFVNPGRFAGYYRQVYGCTPHQTLLR
ncbi:helix-turn-helix transcriptional regulator [Nocardia sp. NPDC057353]|uniref:helix-turn-helix transcriptional regulator n=1 Tax=Nocardia sp. NPDC057353 TaxID=3346104 RepID=UPI00363BE2A2